MLTLNNDSASAAKTEQNAHLLPGLEWFALTDTQLDAYFARVGLDSVFSSANKPPATFETLKTLVKAHTTSVPFDNITRRILIGDRHELKTGGDGLYRKIVERKRGGLCFEQNTFFRAVLAAIGFRVFVISGRVVDEGHALFISTGSDDINSGEDAMYAKLDEALTGIKSFTHGLTHIALLTLIGDKTYFVDVGFGRSEPSVPVLLDLATASSKVTTGMFGEQALIRPVRRSEASSFLSETHFAFLARQPQVKNSGPATVSSPANGPVVYNGKIRNPSDWEVRILFTASETFPNDIIPPAYFISNGSQIFFNSIPLAYIATPTGYVTNVYTKFTVREFDAADGSEHKTTIDAKNAEELALLYEKYFGVSLDDEERQYLENNFNLFRNNQQ